MKTLNRHHLANGWPAHSVYVGRGTPLGNPFPLGEDMTREQSIQAYGIWLRKHVAEKNPVILTALFGLHKESNLICSCAPLPCHANEISAVWQEIQEGKLPLPVNPKQKIYAGIGSRRTPPEILARMTAAARRLDTLGYTLRSGAADGADTAFEQGATRKEIYLPWKGFRGNRSTKHEITPDALAIAELLHPNFKRLSQTATLLMARNGYQILGEHLDTPVDFVLCYTPDGAESEKQRTMKTGGTGQAIALASRWGIPVFNMADELALQRLADFLKT